MNNIKSYIDKRLKVFKYYADKDEELNIKTCIIFNKHGLLASYKKYPYDFSYLNLMYSITKTISSFAIGIACDKGYISLGDKVIDILNPNLSGRIDKNIGLMTVENVLTMSTGLDNDVYSLVHPTKNWVESFLSQDFPKQPGSYYRYSTHASHLMSAIITKVTGDTLADFIFKHLLTPLDIENYQWEVAPDGLTAGGMGFSIKSEDLAKIGIMLLNKGCYYGRRVVSENYLAQATSKQLFKHSEVSKNNNVYCGNYFGYQFHIGKDDYYRMDGAFGQTCLIAEKLNLGVAISSAKSNKQKLIKYIYRYLLCDDNSTFHCNDSTNNKEFNNFSNKVSDVFLGTYLCRENKNNFRSITISDEHNGMGFNFLDYKNKNLKVILSYDDSSINEGLFIKDIEYSSQKYCTKFIDMAESSLNFRVNYLETPYIVNIAIEKSEKKLFVDFSINCSFTMKSDVFECYYVEV